MFNFKFSKFISVAFILVLFNFLPIISIAAGLVPECKDDSGVSAPCGFSDIEKLYENISRFLLIDVLVPLATIAIAFVGVQYLTAFGNSGKLSKVHETAKDILWGIVVALAAYAIIETIFRILTGRGVWSISG